jgi:hypothetical protein
VERLLATKADANAPAAEAHGRTALQAASRVWPSSGDGEIKGRRSSRIGASHLQQDVIGTCRGRWAHQGLRHDEPCRRAKRGGGIERAVEKWPGTREHLYLAKRQAGRLRDPDAMENRAGGERVMGPLNWKA